MQSSKTYAIYWLPSGCHYEVASTTSSAVCTGSAGSASTPSPCGPASTPSTALDNQYETLVNSYFQNINGSAFYNVNTQYSQPNHAINNSSPFGGCYIDTTPYPSGRGTTGSPLSDSDIRAEVSNAISHAGWTSNSTSMFFVYTGLDVVSCEGGCSGTDFCAYHWITAGNPGTIYANMPDVSGGSCNTGHTPNNDSYADNVLNVTSHEHSEAVTDPDTNGGWYDSAGWEDGDECAWLFPPGGNVSLNGHSYYLQSEWSNTDNTCVTSLTAPCTNATETSDHPSGTVSAGTTVHFTVNATCGGTPQYQWWLGTVQGSNVSWQIAVPYGSSNTYAWPTSGLAAGQYYVGYWVENSGHPSSSFDANGALLVTVTGSGAPAPCTNATETKDTSSASISAGTTVHFMLAATCGGTPQYQWWLGTVQGSNVTWQVAAPYGPSNTYTWNTTGLASGEYYVGYWVENTGSPSTSFDANGSILMTITGAATPAACKNVTETKDSPSASVSAGTTVHFSVNATCGGTPQYEWWLGTVQGTNVTWQVAAPYGSTNPYAWNTTNLAPGQYYVGYWVENTGSPSTSSDASGSILMTVTAPAPCVNAVESSDQNSGTVTAGTTVHFSVTATCGGTPQIEWWLGTFQGTSVTWQVLAAYSASTSLAWNTSGLPPGQYYVGYWIENTSSPASTFDANGSLLMTVQ